MSFQCYTSRASLRSTLIGGLFISADGRQRVVPDHCLKQAELLKGARVLRLNYSSCTIEVAGQCLERIFEDASIGRLGTIQAGPPHEAPDTQLWVTSIIMIEPPEAPVSAFEEGHSDA